MDFYDVIKQRKSVRSYMEDPIPEESLARMMEAVSLAPSACNCQPFRFVVVFNAAIRAKITACYGRDWLGLAPAIVLAVGCDAEAWKRPGSQQPITETDLSIAFEHFVLAAAAESLSTCWVCAFDESRLSSLFNLAPGERILALTPLGFALPAECVKNRPNRKPLSALFSIEN